MSAVRIDADRNGMHRLGSQLSRLQKDTNVPRQMGILINWLAAAHLVGVALWAVHLHKVQPHVQSHHLNLELGRRRLRRLRTRQRAARERVGGLHLGHR